MPVDGDTPLPWQPADDRADGGGVTVGGRRTRGAPSSPTFRDYYGGRALVPVILRRTGGKRRYPPWARAGGCLAGVVAVAGGAAPIIRTGGNVAARHDGGDIGLDGRRRRTCSLRRPLH